MPRVFIAALLTLTIVGAALAPGAHAGTVSADVLANAIQQYIKAKDFETAERKAQELTRVSPDYAHGWSLLGYCLTRLERYEESNEAYAEALELGEDRDTINQRRAYNFVKMEQYDTARRLYKTVLQENPSDTRVMSKLAALEAKTENYEDAAYYYGRVLEIEPGNKPVIASLAKIQARTGDGDEARTLLEKTIELNPRDTEALGRLGVLLINEKAFADAVGPLKKLVALNPDDAAAHRNLGIAYYQLDKKGHAAEHFHTAQDLGGGMDGLYGPVADCYIDAGAYGDALAVIREGLEAGEQEAWLYALWGKVHEKSGDYENAIMKFEKAVRTGEQPWSGYAQKQIARQEQLMKRADAMAARQGY